MKRSALTLATLALLALAVPAHARMRAGLLTCNVAPGVGVIVGAQKGFDEAVGVNGLELNAER